MNRIKAYQFVAAAKRHPKRVRPPIIKASRHHGLKVILPWPGLYAVPPHLLNRLKLYGVIQ